MARRSASLEHTPVDGSERVPLHGARVVGRTDANRTIEVTLKVRRKQKLPELSKRPARPLTRALLGRKYGASRQDLRKIRKAFRKFGLRVIEENPATRTVRLRGEVGQFKSAFGTELLDYEHESGGYRGRVGALQVPTELTGIVEAVFGLDNRRVARARRHPKRAKRGALSSPVREKLYTPGELAARYDFPAADGRGECVAILEFGGGFFKSDLKMFCKLVGEPVPAVTAVSVDGTSTSSRDGNEGEVMLDIEIVAGVCPRSRIVVYFAQWTEQGWIAALDTVIQDKANNPSVLSISWGNAEDTDIWTLQAINEINEVLKEAAYLDISVCVAVGDDGSSDGVLDGLAHVDFPGSSPYALSVGGTSIHGKRSALPDFAWKEGDGLRAHGAGSTGGGVSAILPRPVWQRTIEVNPINPKGNVGRCVPDVTANADWSTSPYVLVVDGQVRANGGTSAACPLWAALLVRLNSKRSTKRRIGYLTPVLYTMRGKRPIGSIGCTDVVRGDNRTAKVGGYKARVGYDAVSGWGTPKGTKLLSILPR